MSTPKQHTPRGSRHDEDGRVFIAYYRRDVVTSFIWTGDNDDPVQVGPEPGEDITDSFEVSIAQDQATTDVLAAFREACDAYIETTARLED